MFPNFLILCTSLFLLLPQFTYGLYSVFGEWKRREEETRPLLERWRPSDAVAGYGVVEAEGGGVGGEWGLWGRKMLRAPGQDWEFVDCAVALGVRGAESRCRVDLESVVPAPVGEVLREEVTKVMVRLGCWCPIGFVHWDAYEEEEKKVQVVDVMIRELGDLERTLHMPVLIGKGEKRGMDGLTSQFPRGLTGIQFSLLSPTNPSKILTTATTAFLSDPQTPFHTNPLLPKLLKQKVEGEVKRGEGGGGGKLEGVIHVGIFANMSPGKFDGMHRMLLEQATALGRKRMGVRFEVTFVDTSCQGERLKGSFHEEEILRAGAKVMYICEPCEPNEFCALDEGRMLFHRGLWEDVFVVSSPEELAEPAKNFVLRSMPKFRHFDVAVAVYLRWWDLHPLQIAKWANPSLQTVLHLGSQFFLPPRFWTQFDHPALQRARYIGLGDGTCEVGEGEEEGIVDDEIWSCAWKHHPQFSTPSSPAQLEYVDWDAVFDESEGKISARMRTQVFNEQLYRKETQIVGPQPKTRLPIDLLLAPSFAVASRPEVVASGIPTEVIVTGVDTEVELNPSLVHKDQSLLNQALSLLPTPSTPPPLLVGTISRLSSEKGIGQAMHAFARVLRSLKMNPRADGREVVLVVVGAARDSVFEDVVRSYPRALGIAHRTIVLGFVPPERVHSVMRTLDILLCPYTNPDGETFGLSAVEGMALERTVIQYGIGGMSDFAIDGQTGMIVPNPSVSALADALLRAIQNDTLRSQIGTSARQFTKEYLNKSMWDKTLQSLYAKLGGDSMQQQA